MPSDDVDERVMPASDVKATDYAARGKDATTSNRNATQFSNKDLPTRGIGRNADTTEQGSARNTASKPLFSVKPGGIAGYLSSLTGYPSYVDITAKTDAYVGFLPAKALERMMDRKPIVLLTLAKRLISLLSPLSPSLSV